MNKISTFTLQHGALCNFTGFSLIYRSSFAYNWSQRKINELDQTSIQNFILTIWPLKLTPRSNFLILRKNLHRNSIFPNFCSPPFSSSNYIQVKSSHSGNLQAFHSYLELPLYKIRAKKSVELDDTSILNLFLIFWPLNLTPRSNLTRFSDSTGNSPSK